MLKDMPVLSSVVDETLRLCIASITVRRAMESFELHLPSGSVHVREGDRVVLAPTLTHMDPDIYPDPERFVYDRFCGPSSKPRFKQGRRVPPTVALQPFGGGQSM